MYKVWLPGKLGLVFLLLVWCFVLSGCGKGGIFCTDESVPGITVRVIDGGTGLPAACNAEAWLISGEYSEDISNPWGCGLADSMSVSEVRGAYERSGRYTVMILKDGYAPWVRTDIIVTEDDCHVRTVGLTANLVPLQE